MPVTIHVAKTKGQVWCGVREAWKFPVVVKLGEAATRYYNPALKINLSHEQERALCERCLRGENLHGAQLRLQPQMPTPPVAIKPPTEIDQILELLSKG